MYLKQTVVEAALDRIRWLFEEFKHPVINVSGGKDSTVIFHLCLQVAKEMDLLPMRVLFVDQEAEWEMVIEHIRNIMGHPDVRPYWLQCPIRLSNATSQREPWLYCWKEGEHWMREKEPNSIHVNHYGTISFLEIFGAFLDYYWPNEPACHIAGVRCEESPTRLLGLTDAETYKGETWGKVRNKAKDHYDFYPIYDWTLQDVWKYIHENEHPYCKIYDYMYQYGVKVQDMRVSNVHHETAIHSLYFLQEIEPVMWNALTNRIAGINTIGQLKESWNAPKELPWMFKDWWEYRDYLIDYFITEPDKQDYYRKTFARYDQRYEGKDLEELVKTQIAALMVNDYHGVKLGVFRASHFMTCKSRGKKSGRYW